MKVSIIKRKAIEDHNKVTLRKNRYYMSMICWKRFYLVVGGNCQNQHNQAKKT